MRKFTTTIAALFDKLKPWLEEERCRTCECLQGALVQIELDGGEEAKALVEPRQVAFGQMHRCLGCEPCPPAKVWAEYCREVGNSRLPAAK